MPDAEFIERNATQPTVDGDLEVILLGMVTAVVFVPIDVSLNCFLEEFRWLSVSPLGGWSERSTRSAQS